MTDELTTDERLARVPLFAGLSKKDLKKVSSLATRLDLPVGKELTHQGATGNEFLIVLDGEVDVVIDGNVVASRGPGDYFGEIALLDDRPRVATVIAKTPVSVEVIGRREFKALVDDQPEIAQQLLATMAQRLEEDEAKK
jgi:CRP/FNR family transcriptional regulator, cyclic AMP receptor protein